MKKYITVGLIACASIGCAFAYQPRLVLTGVTEIKEPEVAQIFHGSLQGSPEIFFINAPEGVDLSLQITAPDTTESRKDFDAVIIHTGSQNIILDHHTSSWESFHEPHGEDDYLSGPMLQQKFSAGVYIIQVSNKGNTGNYALFIGHELEFPHHEVRHAMLIVPYIKAMIFHKGWFSWIETRIGSAWAIFLINTCILLTLIFVLYRKMIEASHKRMKPKKK